MKTSIFILLASLSATTVSSVALADPPKATPAEAKIAKEKFKKGIELTQLADRTKDVKLYDAAYLEFAQSEAVVPTDGALWNMVQSALLAKRYVDALNALTLFEKRFHPIEIATHRHHKAAVDALAQATAATAHATIEADPGAYLKVDGESIGVAPLADPIHLVPGRHEFKAGSKTVEATIAAGESYTAKFRTELPAAPVVETAPAPVTTPKTPEQVPAPEVRHVDDTPAKTDGRIPLRTWVTGGFVVATAASAGLGIYFLDKSYRARRDVNDTLAQLGTSRCPASGCASLDSSMQSANSASTASTVFFGIGIATAAGAVASWVFLKEKDSTNTTATVPLIGPGFVGAQWSKSF